jgi:hypothetical protein
MTGAWDFIDPNIVAKVRRINSAHARAHFEPAHATRVAAKRSGRPRASAGKSCGRGHHGVVSCFLPRSSQSIPFLVHLVVSLSFHGDGSGRRARVQPRRIPQGKVDAARRRDEQPAATAAPASVIRTDGRGFT